MTSDVMGQPTPEIDRALSGMGEKLSNHDLAMEVEKVYEKAKDKGTSVVWIMADALRRSKMFLGLLVRTVEDGKSNPALIDEIKEFLEQEVKE